jgi:phage terminase Nu1 subunit (DNA packaging protein)
MRKNKKSQEKPDIVNMARKQRHIHLIEKMRKKPLSKAEITELAKYEKENPSPGVVETKVQVGSAFDVTPRTVTNWMQQGMPIRQDGRYNLLDIKSWLTEREARAKAKITPPNKNNHENYGDVDLRKVKAQAEKIELENAKTRGELISREIAEQTLREMVVSVKRQFLALPKQIAPQLETIPAIEIEQILTERIEEIIAGFAKGKFE